MSVRTILCHFCLHPHLFLFSFNISLPKGEMSFEQDCLVEGGCLSQMHNGTAYREVRQFRSAHHLVRFYFVTRIYSRYMMSILEDFHSGLKPDLVIVNSCIWDISRSVLELIKKMYLEKKKMGLWQIFMGHPHLRGLHHELP